MFWVLLIIFILLLIGTQLLRLPSVRGMIGEKRLNFTLKKLAKKHGGIELTDLMIEDKRSSSQIDNLLLTQKALYVFEMKYYKGHVFGSEKNLNWTVTRKYTYTKKGKRGKRYTKSKVFKQKMYNPIKQNHTHINKIKNITDIADSLPIINIVVFGNRSNLSNVTVSSNIEVINLKEVKRTINHYEENLTKQIDIETQADCLDQLYYHNIIDKKRRKEHVTNLKEKHN